MIFEALQESAKRNELFLIEGGMCRFHRRKDGQLTIREIIATLSGAGTRLLELVVAHAGTQVTSVLAKCPADLEANGWYGRKGFVLEREETARSGRKVNVWRLSL